MLLTVGICLLGSLIGVVLARRGRVADPSGSTYQRTWFWAVMAGVALVAVALVVISLDRN